MSYFKQAAEKAKADGYRAGNRWEKMLDRFLKENHPELVASLGPDYSHFLIVQTNAAMDTMVRLIEEGTNATLAGMMARDDLMTVPADAEEDQEPTPTPDE